MNEREQTDKPQVLVTGGAGYIGSVLVSLLVRSGYRVRVLDNLTYGGASLLPHQANPAFELQVGDLRREDDIDRALSGVKHVVHLAAIVGDPACRDHPELAQAVNKAGAEMLCRKAQAAGVGRFVFASTCSNYGRMTDLEHLVDETSPLNPVSLYAELKVGFERFLMERASSRFSPVCLRFATAYGLSARPRFDLTVNEFTYVLASDRTLEIYGGQFWRPYCHTTDLARACLTVLEADIERVAGQAFNVGITAENYRKISLAELIADELGGVRDRIIAVERNEDPRDYRVNFDRIRRELGFVPSRRVIDGVREILWALRSGLIRDPENHLYRNH